MKSSRLECLSSQIVTNLTAKYIVQSVQSCSQATFHCVQLWRRTDHVLQIKIGKVAPNNEDACDEHLFFDSSVPTITITSEFIHYVMEVVEELEVVEVVEEVMHI